MKRTFTLPAAALMVLGAPALFAQVSGDGLCSFDWTPHYEQLTRYVSGPGTSSSDAKTFLLRVESPPVAGLRETWYVARSAQGAETGAFNRLIGGTDHMDSRFAGEPGYAFQMSLDFPWTNMATAGRTPAGTAAHGLTPLRRYVRSSPFDHQTWLNTATPAGYTSDVTYGGTGGVERLGYQRFGNLLTKADVLGVNGSGPAYGTHFLDNTVLRVDYNKIWGNAIGRITQAGSGRQIVLEPIGDMVQTVVRFPWNETIEDEDCRGPNPTQSGSVGPILSNTHLWTGSPVLSSAKTTDPVTAVQTFKSVVRPLDYRNDGATAAARWAGTEDQTPLAWKGFIERTDDLGCRIGGLTRRDVMKTTSRLILAPNHPLPSQAVYAVNTHWMRPADLVDPPAPGSPVNWNFTVQCHNFRTGLRKPLLHGQNLATCNGEGACADTTCGDPDAEHGIPPDDHAIIVMRADKTFGFAIARFNLAVHEDSRVVYRCGNIPCNTLESGGIIIQAARNRFATPRSIINRTSWGTPLESFLIVNSESVINQRLNELNSDNKSCTN